MARSGLWIILPAKAPELGKSRLRPVLDDEARADLNRLLFARTLHVCRAAGRADRIVVVSRSDEILAGASAMGATPLGEECGAGLNAALEAGRQYAARNGAASVMSLSVDLPFLGTGDIAMMADRFSGENDIVIAPDRHGIGTNGLMMRCGAPIPYRFGAESFSAHAAFARRAGLAISVARSRGLGFDLDVAADLEEASAPSGIWAGVRRHAVVGGNAPCASPA